MNGFIHPERRGEAAAQKAIAGARRALREAAARPNPNAMYLRSLEILIEHYRKTRDR